MEVNKVFLTKEYTKFKPINGNREVNKLHVTRLIESFKLKYLVTLIEKINAKS